MSTIPADTIVRVTPGVLAAGGDAIDLNGLMLTNSVRIPIGAVQSFPDETSVDDYFGPTSPEAQFAAIYFSGFVNCTVLPGALLGAQYNVAAVGAYLRGGKISGLSLTQLQAITGTLSVTIDSVVKTGTISLSGATSFTNAAQLIGLALLISGPPAGSATGSIATTTFTAASGLTGTLAPGQVLSGVGVTAGTYIVSQLNGTPGGLGDYQVSQSQTVASEVISFAQPAVTFDSVSGSLVVVSPTTGSTSSITVGTGTASAALFLTVATGAVLSQGAAPEIPAPFMNTLTSNFRNWATYWMTFNPDASGNDIRFAFAAWTGAQNGRYAAVLTDSDLSPATSTSAPSSLGARIQAAGYGGISLNWQPSETYIAGFISGAVASVNFNQKGGRITFNGKRNEGIVPGVTDQTTADNLKANGYNFYGAIGAANETFQFYENGSVSGAFTWLDSFINSIWLNNNFQTDLITLMQNVNAIPYNAAGKAMIQEGLSDTIQQGLDFGAYVSGVQLSGSQSAAVNAAAGLNISATLTQQGWYLLVGDASPQVRQQRGSPPCTFFYTDGESVQNIDLASIVLL